MTMALTIGLVYDLRTDYLAEGYSAEEVAELDTEATIAALADGLRELGHRVDRIGHGRALCQRLVAGDRWDLIFNVAEGLHGRSREAQVPAVLEMYGLPYVGSDPLVCAATLDKAVAKELVAAAGLPTPRHRVVRVPAEAVAGDLRFPLFAKPIAEGTGKGVGPASRIDSPAALAAVCTDLLARFQQPVLVEEYLPGREFTVGILGTDQEARVLGTLEVRIHPDAPATDYSYEVKELSEAYVDYVPLEDSRLQQAVESLALAAYRALQCRDMGRVDLRLDAAGRPSFMEVNPLPGLHPTHSDLPMIATAAGLSYPALLGAIVDSAVARLGLVAA
jgi:D-alanine-D-alanine ligase